MNTLDFLAERTKTETLNYLGGLFDGEGCICIRKIQRNRGVSYQIACQLCMTDEEIPELFKMLWKGSRSVKFPKLGRKKAYTWVVVSREANNFLLEIKDFLFLKRRQAEIALELYKLVANIPRSKFYKDTDVKLTEKESLYLLLKGLHSTKGQVGSYANGANSANRCDADAELNSEKSDKCVTTIYSDRKV